MGVTLRQLLATADGVPALAVISRFLRAALTPRALCPQSRLQPLYEVACGALTTVRRYLTFRFASQATARRGPFTPENCHRARNLSVANTLEPASLETGHRHLV